MAVSLNQFADKIKELKGDKFICVKSCNYYDMCYNDYDIYCYHVNWEKDTYFLKKYIKNDLFEYYQKQNGDSKKYKKSILNLRKKKFVNKLIECYKTVNFVDIKFDTKWWLYPFDYQTFNLKTNKFHKHSQNDYIMNTCGYSWREPIDDEMDNIYDMLYKVFPKNIDRNGILYLLCLALEGNYHKVVTIHGYEGNRIILKDMISQSFMDYCTEYDARNKDKVIFLDNLEELQDIKYNKIIAFISDDIPILSDEITNIHVGHCNSFKLYEFMNSCKYPLYDKLDNHKYAFLKTLFSAYHGIHNIIQKICSIEHFDILFEIKQNILTKFIVMMATDDLLKN